MPVPERVSRAVFEPEQGPELEPALLLLSLETLEKQIQVLVQKQKVQQVQEPEPVVVHEPVPPLEQARVLEEEQGLEFERESEPGLEPAVVLERMPPLHLVRELGPVLGLMRVPKQALGQRSKPELVPRLLQEHEQEQEQELLFLPVEQVQVRSAVEVLALERGSAFQATVEK